MKLILILQIRNQVQELDRIHDAGTTIVMATHDLDLAYSWADWVIVLDEGRLVLSEQAQQVFTQMDVLNQLQLGIPTLLECWYALPATWRDLRAPPKTIAELRSYGLNRFTV